MNPRIKRKLVAILHLVEDAPDYYSLCARYHDMTGYIDGIADVGVITPAQRGKFITLAVKAFNEREYMLNLYDVEG